MEDMTTPLPTDAENAAPGGEETSAAPGGTETPAAPGAESGEGGAAPAGETGERAAEAPKEPAPAPDAAAPETGEEHDGPDADWYRRDGEDFRRAYPDVPLTRLVEDAQFAAFAEGKVGTRPLREIYADYRAMERTYEDRARRMAAEMLAAARATPGALGHAAPGTGYYTREQVHAMSQAEVAAHYEEIRRSMAAWN